MHFIDAKWEQKANSHQKGMFVSSRNACRMLLCQNSPSERGRSCLEAKQENIQTSSLQHGHFSQTTAFCGVCTWKFNWHGSRGCNKGLQAPGAELEEAGEVWGGCSAVLAVVGTQQTTPVLPPLGTFQSLKSPPASLDRYLGIRNCCLSCLPELDNPHSTCLELAHQGREN